MTNENEEKQECAACGCGEGNLTCSPCKWIWIILAVAIAATLIARSGKKNVPADTQTDNGAQTAAEFAAPDAAGPASAVPGEALPRLLDLGATKCIPCKMMAPILEDLKKTYAGKIEVQFIDVWATPDAAKEYGIKLIPTQIFYDAHGKELFRHEGFFGKEDILAKWKELGVELEQKSAVSNQNSE